MAAKSNPPSADTATTAASMNTSNYFSKTGGGVQPRRPTGNETAKVGGLFENGLMNKKGGPPILTNKAQNFKISPQKGMHQTTQAHQIGGKNSMKTLFQNQ